MNLHTLSSSRRKLRSAARTVSAHLPNGLPPALVFTDPRRSASPIDLAENLPANWALVYRHYGDPNAESVARRLRRCTHRKQTRLLIGADPILAQRVGADGVHWPERMAGQARKWAARFPLNTISAHASRSVFTHLPRGIDARVLSTIFPSQSPSAGVAMGPIRFRFVTIKAPQPVYALGGVSADTANRVARYSGLAGVGILKEDSGSRT